MSVYQGGDFLATSPRFRFGDLMSAQIYMDKELAFRSPFKWARTKKRVLDWMESHITDQSDFQKFCKWLPETNMYDIGGRQIAKIRRNTVEVVEDATNRFKLIIYDEKGNPTTTPVFRFDDLMFFEKFNAWKKGEFWGWVGHRNPFHLLGRSKARVLEWCKNNLRSDVDFDAFQEMLKMRTNNPADTTPGWFQDGWLFHF